MCLDRVHWCFQVHPSTIETVAYEMYIRGMFGPQMMIVLGESLQIEALLASQASFSVLSGALVIRVAYDGSTYEELSYMLNYQQANFPYVPDRPGFYGPLTYDAMAVAIQAVFDMRCAGVNASAMSTSAINNISMSYLRKVKFNGASGQVQFASNSNERVIPSSFEIWNLQGLRFTKVSVEDGAI